MIFFQKIFQPIVVRCWEEGQHITFMVIVRCSVLTYSDTLLSFMVGDILLIIFTLEM